MTTKRDVKEAVKEKYGQAALRVVSGLGNACCGTSPSASCGCDPITSDLYEEAQQRELPEAAVQASLGCGNPTALAELRPGEVVLDLGSGGGIDVLLSARRVGPTGKAYGLDMTDEMLSLARENQRKAGVENVEFLKGEIENIPLPDNSVDVIISNCVITLSGDKDRVISEAFRMSSLGAGSRLKCAAIWNFGPVVSRALWKNPSTKRSSLLRVSLKSEWSRRRYTRLKRPGNFSRGPASMLMPLPLWSTASS